MNDHGRSLKVLEIKQNINKNMLGSRGTVFSVVQSGLLNKKLKRSFSR